MLGSDGVRSAMMRLMATTLATCPCSGGSVPEVGDDGVGRVQGSASEDEPTRGRPASPPIPDGGAHQGVRWVDLENGQQLFAGWVCGAVRADASEVRQCRQQRNIVEFGCRRAWVGG